MSKNLNLTVSYLSYEGTPPTNSPKDAIKIESTIQNDPMTSDSRQQIVLPAAGSAQVVAMPASPCGYLLIFTDQPIAMALNGAAAVNLSPQTHGVKCPVALIKGAITSLSVNCPGATPANVDIILAAA